MEPCEGRCILEWREWSRWSKCSQLCGAGVMSRTRKCLKGTDYVDPQYCLDGIENELITGEYYNETKECNTLMCNNWSSWVDGTCSRKCGGTLVRTRACIGLGFERPQIFDARRNVCTQETVSCARSDCDAVYLAWSTWSDCSATRGMGIQQRQRLCVSSSAGSQQPRDLSAVNCKHLGDPNEIRTCYPVAS